MNRSVRKTLTVVLSFTLIIILLPTIKNLLLYFKYEHGNQALIKTDGKSGVLQGSWHGVFDTYQCGLDERHDLTYEFSTDSTGVLYYTFYCDRIDGNIAMVYSWNSLLPFDKVNARKYVIHLSVDETYIKYLPGEQSLYQDTVYSKYQVCFDSLFIDAAAWEYPYQDEPLWGFAFSERLATVSDLLKFWLPWKYMFSRH